MSERLLAGFSMRAVTTFYRRAWLMARDLAEPIDPVEARTPYDLVELTVRDISLLSRYQPHRAPAALQWRFETGDRCFGAFVCDRLAHSRWLSNGTVTIPYLSCRVGLPADAVYCHDAFTLPEFRGLALAPAAYARLLLQLRGEGFRRSLSIVAVENRSGRRVLEKAGYREIGFASLLRLPFWHYLLQRGDAGAAVGFPRLQSGSPREAHG